MKRERESCTATDLDSVVTRRITLSLSEMVRSANTRMLADCLDT